MKTLCEFLLLLGVLTSVLTAQPKFDITGGTRFDLGNVINSVPSKHILTINNTGTDTLILSDVGASCGCTATMLSNDHIPPHGSGTLSVTFNANQFEGKVEKKISMNTNDTTHRHVEIYFTANVVRLIEIEPEYLFFKARKDSSATQTLTIKNISKDTIEIVTLTPTSELLSLTISSQHLKPGDAGALTATYTTKTTGTFNGNIEIRTNHPQVPSFNIRFFGWAK